MKNNTSKPYYLKQTIETVKVVIELKKEQNIQIVNLETHPAKDTNNFWNMLTDGLIKIFPVLCNVAFRLFINTFYLWI